MGIGEISPSGKSGLYVMKRLFGLVSDTLFLAELPHVRAADFRSLFMGGEEWEVLSSGYDVRKTDPYLRCLREALNTYKALERRIDAAIGMSEDIMSAVFSEDSASSGMSEGFAREIRMIRAERAMLELRIREAKTRFRNIVESEGAAATFLAKRVAKFEDLSRRDERIAAWLRRKHAEWRNGAVPAVMAFRESDEFLRTAEADAWTADFYETHAWLAARETEGTLGRMKSALLFPEIRSRLAATEIAEEVRERLEDAMAWMVPVRERVEILDTDPETFREIMAIRESLGIALEIMLPS